MKRNLSILLLLLFATINFSNAQLKNLTIGNDSRTFMTSDGKPFFWLGDTGWLLFVKLNRQETLQYLDVRKAQGFNVIQVMVVHDVNNAKNVYGQYAIKGGDISQPVVTKGSDTADAAQYDFWDHVDFVIGEAGKRGLYMALVPVWGSNVKEKKVTSKQAEIFSRFLANRYKDYTNIIWLNGGDIKGTVGMDVWQTIGRTIKKYDPNHLMTFHPRGRYSSSEWFQNASWLDFNMFQSGHRNYAQDTSADEKNHFGEDNWRYVNVDYKKIPTKPTMDGEPSYENIPQGLHDSLQTRWDAADVRRYAYWSVFAGGAGFTYGENAIMQFHKNDGKKGSYGVTEPWTKTLYAPGALQIHFIKDLLADYAYWQRKPAQQIIVNNQGKKYHYLLATQGKDFAMVYTYCGEPITIDASKMNFTIGATMWFSPSTGAQYNATPIGDNKQLKFIPKGSPVDGNDWVLILKKNK